MTIQRCLIVDTETTGLQPGVDQTIEIGLILYSVPTRCRLQSFATLLPADDNPAESTNHIPAAALREFRVSRSIIETTVSAMLAAADVIVAHNADFDRQFFPLATSLPWICTSEHFEWPRAKRQRPALVNLAVDHGVPVVSAHRALNDCDLIASLFDRLPDLGVRLSNALAVALEPVALCRAHVSYDERQLAKEAGFRWDRDRGMWLKKLRQSEAAKLPFRIEAVDQQQLLISALSS